MLESVERSFAVGDAEVAGDVVEGAALHDPALRVGGCDVLNPLPYVAEDVEESVGVGLFLRDVMGGVAAVAVVRCDFADLALARSLNFAERGEFPFGFRWQAHAYAFAVVCGGVPIDLLDGPLRAFVAAWI